MDDETQIDIERKGYDPESIVQIAEFGDEAAVNSDVSSIRSGSRSWDRGGIRHPNNVLLWSDAEPKRGNGAIYNLELWLDSHGYNQPKGMVVPGQAPTSRSWMDASWMPLPRSTSATRRRCAPCCTRTSTGSECATA